MISVQNVTKKFSNGKGLFHITFEVKEGEVFGYLGPNGAGKSTTIRNLMGFIKPTDGKATIFGLDCWNEAVENSKRSWLSTRRNLFIEGMNGLEFFEVNARNAWAKGYEKTR